LTAKPDRRKLGCLSNRDKTLMQWLRTITRFVRVLVALFAVAQFAGVVSSPLTSARSFSTAVALHFDHHHAQDNSQDNGGQGTLHHHGDQSEDGADHCCALHAFFAGVLPSEIAVQIMAITGQRFAADLADSSVGADPSRLDRPPRPFAVI